MEHILVNCNHCGNVLETTKTTKFVTCMICNSSLEVMVTSSSYYTRVKLDNEPIKPLESFEPIESLEPIEPIQPLVQNAISNLTPTVRPEIQQKIIALKKSWKAKHSDYTIYSNLPSKDDSDYPIFNIAIFLAGLLILFATPSDNPGLSVIGFIVIVFGVFEFFVRTSRKNKYLKDKKIYEAELQLLNDQLYSKIDT